MPENKGMHIKIDVYKPSGKWYAGENVRHNIDIPIYEPAFNEFVKEHLPAQYGGGFVVVTSCDDDPGFHNVLLRYDELMNIM